MKKIHLFWGLSFLLLAGGCAKPRYTAQPLVTGGDLRGMHSLTITPDGRVLASSPFSLNIIEIDPVTLNWKPVSRKPFGMPWELASITSDLVVYHDAVRKSLDAWSDTSTGRIIREKQPGPLKLTATVDGRLIVGRGGDKPELWEIGTHKGEPLFLMSDSIGAMTALAAARDGGVWVALRTSRQITRIDAVTGQFHSLGLDYRGITALAEDDRGQVWAAARDEAGPMLWSINAHSGERQSRVLPVAFDAMTVAGEKIIAANRAGNSLWVKSPQVEAPVVMYQSPLVTPGGLGLADGGGSNVARLYVADMYSVKEFSAQTGALLRTIAIPDHKGQPVYPNNVAVFGEYLLVTSWISGSVHLLEAASGRVVWTADGLHAPQSAVLLPGGDVIVAELATSFLVRLSRSPGRENVVVTTDKEGPKGPCGLALSPTGGIYVTELFSGAVSFVDPYAFYFRPIAANLDRPEGVAVMPDGDLVVAEAGRGRLLRIDPDNGDVEELAANLPIGEEPLGGLPPAWHFSGVAVSAMGEIYLSCDRANSVLKLTPR